MTREDVIAVLKAHEPQLRRRGVVRAGLFGSMARGEAGPDSDIDVLIRFDEAASVTLYDYVALKRYVSTVLKRRFKCPVDVIDLDGMRGFARPAAERDALYAF